MKCVLSAALLAAAVSLVGCDNTPVQRVAIPSPADPNAYQPIPQFKPLPPQMDPSQAPQNPAIDAFLQAYVQNRSPRMMVFVNRTIQGDPMPKEVAADAPSGKYDEVGAAAGDYDMLEAAMVSYFDDSGKVQIQDSEAARTKLSRDQILRIENGDPQAARLLAQNLQTDILIRLAASPTQQSAHGPAIRMVAKAINLSNGRILGEEYIDMALPMSKSNINGYARYLSERLMGDMARKWGVGPDASTQTVELHVYKTASVDDAIKVRNWLQHTRGVGTVITRGATGGSSTAFAAFDVTYAGAPEDLYADLKDAIGQSTGIKAVDIQANTIDLEVTGQLNLVTTTQKTETTTTTETHTTEEKSIEPINPAATQQQ